jgi:hypothetical protein
MARKKDAAKPSVLPYNPTPWIELQKNIDIWAEKKREQEYRRRLTPEQLIAYDAGLESIRRQRAEIQGSTYQPNDLPPLIKDHQDAYDLICKDGPLSGKQIVNRLNITSQSLFTGKYVPELKKRGIRNRRGLGYYHPDFYNPGPTVAKR